MFIDYGPEWEAAWEKYVKEWSPPPGADEYMPASTIKEPLRTEEEELTDPYPDNVVYYCHYGYEPGIPEGQWEWEDEFINLPLYPCEIHAREAVVVSEADGSTEYRYTLVMLEEDEIGEHVIRPVWPIPSGEVHVLTNVPRRAIEVRDKQYEKDEFLENEHSFRHEMMMPDEIFPEAWKNIP